MKYIFFKIPWSWKKMYFVPYAHEALGLTCSNINYANCARVGEPFNNLWIDECQICWLHEKDNMPASGNNLSNTQWQPKGENLPSNQKVKIQMLQIEHGFV